MAGGIRINIKLKDMTRLVIIIISYFIVLNIQAQEQKMEFSDHLSDLDCLSSIAKDGIEKQIWDIKELTERNDSCSNYISLRTFELKADTLIIKRKEDQELSKLIETILTIENDSVAIARFIINEAIDYTNGKAGKHLVKEELKELSTPISIKFVYNGQKIKIDFVSQMKKN